MIAVGFDIEMLLLLLQSILGWRTLLQFFDVDLCASWDVKGLCIFYIVLTLLLAELVALHHLREMLVEGWVEEKLMEGCDLSLQKGLLTL